MEHTYIFSNAAQNCMWLADLIQCGSELPLAYKTASMQLRDGSLHAGTVPSMQFNKDMVAFKAGKVNTFPKPMNTNIQAIVQTPVKACYEL